MSLWKEIPGFQEKMSQVNRKIDSFLSTDDPLMSKVMEWILRRRGKQLRPAIMLLSASFGTWHNRVIDMAAALEIIHTASLVHDDIIDEAGERRGQESVQSRFGKNVAVYAGDFMILSALSNLSSIPTKRQAGYFRSLSEMCRGELLQYENLHNINLTKEDYLRRIHGKTGSLFHLACWMGAEECECTPEIAEALQNFGTSFGYLFQLQDDIMDFVNAAHMGKPTGSDLKDGIYSLPVIFALDAPKTRNALRRLLSRYKAHPDESTLLTIHKIIQQTNALQRSMQVMIEYADEATAALQVLPATAERDCFISLTTNLCENVKCAAC